MSKCATVDIYDSLEHCLGETVLPGVAPHAGAWIETYVAGSEPAEPEQKEQHEMSIDMVRAIGAARKTISKYRKALSAKQQDPERIEVAKQKIQAAVDVIREAGAEFSEATVKELSSYGIKFS